MTLQKIFWVSLLTGCGGVKAPDARWGMANPAGDEIISYNLKRDYTYTTEGMKLKPSAKPVYLPFKSRYDIEGWVCMSPTDFKKTRATVEKLISRYEDGCK